MALCNSVADMVSSGLLSELEMEPVVNLLVLAQPATLAASATINAVMIRRLPLTFGAWIGIGTLVSILARPLLAVFPPAEIFC
ncbi:hypothetical protein MPLB_250011 [Mesorhizobium sp. ORS 3324]|nr:hypothetical protein MPLB_250011 [Mesorhizobium sp. ORS 3324]